MHSLLEKTISCPYCGESIDIFIDDSAAQHSGAQHSYIEDCQVCCRPIVLTVTCHADGDVLVTAAHENE